MYYTRFDTSVCEIIAVSDGRALTNLHLNTGKGKRTFAIEKSWIRNDELFREIKEQITDFLEGSRTSFTIDLDPQGTDFQKKVWRELQKIPYGEKRSYKEIAIALGNPNACRAVGMANGKNPIPLIIPCHRVIGSSGALTGFAHGLEIKEKLLSLEV